MVVDILYITKHFEVLHYLNFIFMFKVINIMSVLITHSLPTHCPLITLITLINLKFSNHNDASTLMPQSIK